MKVSKSPLGIKLKGPRIWQPEEGEAARQELNKVLERTVSGDTVTIDCSAVKVFDVSFAAALFANTVASLALAFPGRCLVVSGLNDTTRKNLDPALKDAGLMLAELDGDSFRLRGKFSPSDEQTLEFLHEKKRPFSVRELADALSINVTAANERLTKLAKMAILFRQTASSGRNQQLFVAPAI